MKFQNKTVLAIVFSLPILLIGFQNCGPAASLEDADPGTPPKATEKVVSEIPANSYEKVKTLDYSQGSPQIEKIVDLNTGVLSQFAIGSDTGIQCDLPNDVLAEFQNLLTNVNICEPGPLPDNMAVCMAIGMDDIELTDASGGSQRLRPTVCQNGRFLCEGKDQLLRDLLTDISCE